MKVVLRKQGNSIVLALRASILRKLGLKAGQSMRLDTTADGHVTLIAQRRHTLSELITQCDLTAAPPRDVALWDISRPVGREVW